ncbi:MAG: hypothetical protein Q8M92_10735 [Candidatus Subteraquimicrobiales bacterium]|nr:hypothetical protein [Candidatus Subteraquimicrobiales bacterium]
MKVTVLKKLIVKNILSAVAVAIFGFILLNLAFLFDFFVHYLAIELVKLFTGVNPLIAYKWFPPTMHLMFVVIIGLISWLIFRSKLRVLFKAIYMTVPLAVVFATLGIFLYRWPIAAYLIGSLLSVGILYYFYRTKQPWIYYYTLILISLTMLFVGLSGVEI